VTFIQSNDFSQMGDQVSQSGDSHILKGNEIFKQFTDQFKLFTVLFFENECVSKK